MTDTNSNVEQLRGQGAHTTEEMGADSPEQVKVSVAPHELYANESQETDHYESEVLKEKEIAKKNKGKAVKKILVTATKWTLGMAVIGGGAYQAYTHQDAIMSFASSFNSPKEVTTVSKHDMALFKDQIATQLEEMRGEMIAGLNSKLDATRLKGINATVQGAFNTANEAKKLAQESKVAVNEHKERVDELAARLDTYDESIGKIQNFIENKAAQKGQTVTAGELARYKTQLWKDIKQLHAEGGVKSKTATSTPKVAIQSRTNQASTKPKSNAGSKEERAAIDSGNPTKPAGNPVPTVREVDGIRLYSVTSVGGEYYAHLAGDVVLNFSPVGGYITENSKYFIKAISASSSITTPDSILLQNEETKEMVILQKTR